MLSDVISRIGVGMIYYGTFSSVSSLFATKISDERIGISLIVFSLTLAYFLKKRLQITFIGPGARKPTKGM